MGRTCGAEIHRQTMLLWIVALVVALGWHVAPVAAWGATGHEIVATIAQTQLHPDVRAHLCTILPPEQTAYRSYYPRDSSGVHQHCHLAPLAAWADRVHGVYPWASHLHYINPVDDNPPSHCEYGEHGWQDHGTGNVLEALVNYTSQLTTATGYQRDLALRFLTHFMGDTHQPLHLTGRARGGNDVAVHFNGRYARLHTVWDSLLINDQIRDLANYTTPLPSARIESALLGRTYDAYIRWILAEGLGQAQGANAQPAWWTSDDVASWSQCPDRLSDKIVHDDETFADRKMSRLHRLRWLRAVAPNSSHMAQRVYATIFRSVPDNGASTHVQDPAAVDDTDLPICPYAWTKPMHGLVCSYAFAAPVPTVNDDHDRDRRTPLVELSIPEYAGRIAQDKVIHQQLARAGIRLAAVLNTILLPEAQKTRHATVAEEGNGASVMVSRTRSSSISLEQQHEAPSLLADNANEHGRRRGGHHSAGNGKGKPGASPIISLIKVTASSIAEVIILSSVGYIMARRGVLDKRTQTKFNKVNVSIFTPALLFSKVAFSLDPGRLAELVIVPAGFVIITVISGLSALLLSWIARLPKSQRNFSVACAITPNSNSLPVALMQSLVVTVPQLHWEEEGEAEDTVNGMLGRALTYLVLFSTLGMFLRWSLASQLLSTMEESEDEIGEEPVTGIPTEGAQQPATGRLIDHDDETHGTLTDTPTREEDNSSQNGAALNGTPEINVRRPTADGGGTESLARSRRQASLPPNHHGPPGWARSFPNSPGGSVDDDDGAEDDSNGLATSPRWQQRRRSCWSSVVTSTRKYVVRPFNAVTSFMTMPLYAALLSLVVAMIPPLQAVISSIEPLVGALETAGACSIPLTMVVLGAYFYDESDAPQPAEPTDAARRPADGENTLVNSAAHAKRTSLSFARNVWKDNGSMPDSVVTSRNGSTSGHDTASDAGTTPVEPSSSPAWPMSTLSSRRALLEKAEREKRKLSMERRTIIVSVGSRMIMTPILLLPLLAWYAIATRYNVVDDPVFICSACLLIGSPPALTLAQITSQSAKGSNSSFERLISKTIFISYAIMATPTTIVLVLTALLIAENDH